MQNKSHTILRKRGFTMIELLAVVTIMAILATIGLVSFTNATRNARNNKRMTDIQNIRQALVLHRSETGCYPADLATLTTNYMRDGIPIDPQPATHVYTYTPASESPLGSGCYRTFTLSSFLEGTPSSYDVTNP